MPWGAIAPIYAAACALRVRPSVGETNEIIDFTRMREALKSKDAWLAYMAEQRERRRQRLIDARGKRMSTRLERRRSAILAKWKQRGKVAAWCAIATPLAIAALAGAWRFAMWMVVS